MAHAVNLKGNVNIMASNSHVSKKLVIAGVVAVAAAAIGAGTMLPAHAVEVFTPGKSVPGTGPTQADALSRAYASCQQMGYNADRVDNTFNNDDGSVTVILYCYTV
jgi:hypothetical protein